MALELELARQVAAAREPDPLTPIAVLIGGTLQRPYLQRRLADLTGGIANVHFLTPADFALKLGEKSMIAAGRRPLPPLADRILLRQLAADHDGYFEPVRETPGLSDALHRLVRELRGAGYDGPALETAIADACEVPDKAETIVELFSTFLERRADFYGPDDCLLAADDESSPWTHMFAFGLWEGTPALRAAIARLSAHIPFAAFLPSTGTSADDAHAEIQTWLEESGAEHVQLDDEPTDSTLSAVKSQLFHREREALNHDGTLQLVSAPDPTREVREVARACMDWAREGIRFHEMAIAYRNPEPYRATIEAVFTEAGIPVYLHEGSPLSERPLGRQALALLELMESQLERRRVMDFLSDLRLPSETREEYDSPSITRWDRISRKAGVVRGLDQWDARLTAHATSLGESDRDWQRNEVPRVESLLSFVRGLASLIGEQPSVAPWSEQLAYLERFFAKYIHDAKPIFEALDGLKRFDALGETVTAKRFRDTVRAAIENLRSDQVTTGRAGAFGLRGVNVLDMSSLRHLGFRAVAIVGLVERSFPPPPRPDPILLDPERQRLNEAAPAPLPLRVMGPDPEPLQFAVGVGAARERLLATYPRKGGGSGRVQLPSSFFRALAEAAMGEPVAAQDVDGLPSSVYTHARGTRIGAENPESALSRAEYDRSLIETDAALGRALLTRDEPRMTAAFAGRAARFRRSLTEFDGVLSSEGLARLAEMSPQDWRHSPSGLQTYASCPHRYFLGSVLRLGKSDDPEALVQMSALDRGSLIHLILERFLREDPAPGEERLFGPSEEQRLLEIAAEEATNCETRGETGYSLLWKYDQTNLREDLIRWLENERQDPEVRVLTEGDYEVRFAGWAGGGSEGRLSSDEPLEITAKGVKLRVIGKMDRLNWDPEKSRFRVVDYKTGRIWDEKDSKLVGGRTIQLPIYVLAAARALEVDAERGSAEYHYSTRAGRFQRRVFTQEALRERRDDLETVLARIATGINEGQFQMNPPSARDCTWCDFDRICPSARHRQIERKADDEVAQSFAQMREVE